MKRIFTLFIALGLLTAVQAQNGRGDNRDGRQRDQQTERQFDQRDFDNGYSNDQYNKDVRYVKSNPGMERKMAKQVAGINREYDFRIQRVKNNFFLSRWEKQRQVRFLQEQRQREIRMVYARFHKNNNRHDDRYDRY